MNKKIKEQFCFRTGSQAAEVVHIWKSTVEKSNEWGDELYILSLDIRKAFDSVSVLAVAEELLFGTPSHVPDCCAILFQHRDLHLRVQLDGILTDPFPYNRGVRQGDPLSPALFNTAIDRTMSRLKSAWGKKGYGCFLDEHITRTMLADDTVLASRRFEDIQDMASSLRDAFRPLGLDFAWDKCKWITNQSDLHDRTLKVDTFTIPRAMSHEGLKILGAYITTDSRYTTEIENRMSRAWASFWADQYIFLNYNTSIARRRQCFEKVVSKSALWGCESWHLSREQLVRIEGVQLNMIRRIVRTRRRPAEGWLDWLVRSNGVARDWMQRSSVRSWDVQHLERVWHWAGHVARKQDSLVLAAVRFRCRTWDNEQVAVLGKFRPRRPRQDRYWRWEDDIYTFKGDYWWAAAHDRELWKDAATDFSSWKSTRS